MTLHIDTLRPDDYPQWQALWRDYLAFYKTEMPQSLYDRNWDRLMRIQDDYRGFALRYSDEGLEKRLVGLAHYLFHDTGWSLTPTCYLQDLYVTTDLRGGGGGRLLIQAVARQARRRGCERLYWLTHQDNAVARRLYDQVAQFSGYLRYEISLHPGFVA